MSEIKVGSTVFGSWQVTKKIGHGAFSDVYRIEKRVGDDVKQDALKVIHVSDNRQNPNFRNQIEAEASIMNKFENLPNIVWFSDCQFLPDMESDEPDDKYLIKMELLSPLSKHDYHLTVEDVLDIGINICTALQECEMKHILHRDIKPQNIFFKTVNGSRKLYELGDFGAAIYSERPVSGAVGTIPYMAPEVYNNRFYFHNADVYSLGMVLYQYLNYNCLPFMNVQAKNITRENKDLLENANKRRFSGEPIPAISGLDPRLNQILQLALAFNPANRYQSADDLKRALENYRMAIRKEKEAGPNSRVPVWNDPYGTDTPHPGPVSGGNPGAGPNGGYGTPGAGPNGGYGTPGAGPNGGYGNPGAGPNGGYGTPGKGSVSRNSGQDDWEEEDISHKVKAVLIVGIIAAISVIACVLAYLFLGNNTDFTIDDCNGMNVFSEEFADYKEELENHGYEVEIAADSTGNPEEAGNIYNYDTSPNDDSSEKDIVTYYYSTAPDVIGQTGDTARQMLEASGWSCSVMQSSDCSSNPVDEGCVYAQELDADDPSTVIIYIYSAQ